MIIYHRTHGKIVSTSVMLGARGSVINHGSHVWDKHREKVDNLEEGGDVFVTGATFVGAVYEGITMSRESMVRYIQDAKVR